MIGFAYNINLFYVLKIKVIGIAYNINLFYVQKIKVIGFTDNRYFKFGGFFNDLV